MLLRSTSCSISCTSSGVVFPSPNGWFDILTCRLADSVRSLISKFQASQLSLLCLPSHPQSKYLLLNFGFGPSGVVALPNMASADSSQFFSSPLDDNSTWQIKRSPRVMRNLFRTYACHIYVRAFRVSIGLQDYWPPYPARSPIM